MALEEGYSVFAPPRSVPIIGQPVAAHRLNQMIRLNARKNKSLLRCHRKRGHF